MKVITSIAMMLVSTLHFSQSVVGKWKTIDDETGKVTIQFEPAWFKKKAPYAPSGIWSVNKVDVQRKEWIAFNDAYKKNPDAAMQSTSIGLGQIMGFYYKKLGYNTVGEMWDDAKKGIEEQIEQMVKFINSNPNLLNALKNHDWTKVATIYNGSGFMDLAKKYHRTPYDEAMALAYNRFKNI